MYEHIAQLARYSASRFFKSAQEVSPGGSSGSVGPRTGPPTKAELGLDKKNLSRGLGSGRDFTQPPGYGRTEQDMLNMPPHLQAAAGLGEMVDEGEFTDSLMKGHGPGIAAAVSEMYRPDLRAQSKAQGSGGWDVIKDQLMEAWNNMSGNAGEHDYVPEASQKNAPAVATFVPGTRATYRSQRQNDMQDAIDWRRYKKENPDG